MNRLSREKSPYLLQHADNPVAWQPWDEQALAMARQQNKPIFVSIGYATCHWCHVMAHESFADEQIARQLNDDFIAIKVDREERPDIDNAMMQACHLLGKRGGWPLNLFLAPTGQPFFAMTYAPKRSQANFVGLSEIIDHIVRLWHEQPQRLLDAGQKLSTAIYQWNEQQQAQSLDERILETAAERLKEQYDQVNGGFGPAPKFPQPHNWILLLQLAKRLSDPQLAGMALHSLDKIAAGGISDQIGGGLHRYAVDAHWLVPHFEKMLYDQALICEAYLAAWRYQGDERFQLACEQILDFVLRELRAPEGGFYCAIDADSQGQEGLYYLWSADELKRLLSAAEYSLCAHCYQISESGNFEGKNIPNRPSSMATLAQQVELTTSQLDQQLSAINHKLLKQRQLRIAPQTDDKILSGWNGLMIAALAQAGIDFGREDYLQAARQAFEFVRSRMMQNGRLKRSYRDGAAAIDAFHEDYAWLTQAALALDQAQPEEGYLEVAVALQQQCTRLFSDGNGGYYDAAVEPVAGLGRGRSRQDGAIPAASSVTARNLIKLAQLTHKQSYRQQAQALIALQLEQADQHPTAFACILLALDELLAGQQAAGRFHNDR